jgi:phosphoglycolate phosphatase-like HAD superfamily hydrolase
MSQYQAFVFDFDGVLADSVEIKTEAFRQMYLSHGEEIADRVVLHHRENGGMPRLQKFVHYQKEFLGKPASDEELAGLCRVFSDLVVKNIVAADEILGVSDFLKNWHGALPMFIDSATPDSELREIVDQRGLNGYFEGVFGSDRTKKENLVAILDQNGFIPERVLFFGDALSDYAAARSCGTDFMGIVPGAEAILIRQHPDVNWCRNFMELTLSQVERT